MYVNNKKENDIGNKKHISVQFKKRFVLRWYGIS